MTTTVQAGDLGVLMTLSAIAYASDSSQDLPTLKAAIVAELAKPGYATGGTWSLAFGPVRFPGSDSLMYVAQNQAGNALALVLRGTAPSKESQDMEFPALQSPYPYAGMTNANVSGTYLYALQGMLGETDGGLDLAGFLQSRADNSDGLTIQVTGHSQGGAITPMLLAWVIGESAGWTKATNLRILGRAFAPLSAGDPNFADWFATNADCALVVNPLDVIPFFYADIQTVIDQGIPAPVPLTDKAGYDYLNNAAKKAGTWQQIARQTTLTATPLDPSLPYDTQKDGQHNANSYLYLLGAPQTDVGTPSPMS